MCVCAFACARFRHISSALVGGLGNEKPAPRQILLGLLAVVEVSRCQQTVPTAKPSSSEALQKLQTNSAAPKRFDRSNPAWKWFNRPRATWAHAGRAGREGLQNTRRRLLCSLTASFNSKKKLGDGHAICPLPCNRSQESPAGGRARVNAFDRSIDRLDLARPTRPVIVPKAFLPQPPRPAFRNRNGEFAGRFCAAHACPPAYDLDRFIYRRNPPVGRRVPAYAYTHVTRTPSTQGRSVG